MSIQSDAEWLHVLLTRPLDLQHWQVPVIDGYIPVDATTFTPAAAWSYGGVAHPNYWHVPPCITPVSLHRRMREPSQAEVNGMPSEAHNSAAAVAADAISCDSTYCGVFVSRGHWRARTYLLGDKQVFLGRYSSEEEAALAFDCAAYCVYGRWGHFRVCAARGVCAHVCVHDCALCPQLASSGQVHTLTAPIPRLYVTDHDWHFILTTSMTVKEASPGRLSTHARPTSRKV